MGAVDAREISLLFERHAPAVYRRALRILGNAADAEEATQEVFVRVVRGADRFQHQSQLTTWLYQITTNYCLNQVRDRNRRRALSDERLAPADGDGVAPAASEELSLLRRLLAEADPKQAQAAIYVFVDGMSHAEAAELLGVSRRTVGNLVERFQERAREMTEATAPAAAAGGRRTP